MRNSIFDDAELADANLHKADLCGADLTNARIDNLTEFRGAKYDDATKLPSNFSQWNVMEWKGSGPDPFKQFQAIVDARYGVVYSVNQYSPNWITQK